MRVNTFLYQFEIKGLKGEALNAHINPRQALLFFACALFLLFGVQSPASAATHDVAAGKSIAAAIAKASSGDTIRIAAGTYAESVRVTKPGLTITSAAAPGGEPAVILRSAKAPALSDSQNTVWRGIAFQTAAPGGPIADFSQFKGRVEYCRFDSGEGTPGKISAVISGTGVFHGTTFANQRSGGEGVQILSGNPLFTYCRFENLADGAILLKKGDARFQNCLFLRNGHILNRQDAASKAEMVNSVLFMNTSRDLFPGKTTNPVSISHSVYTPARDTTDITDFKVLGAIETMAGVKLESTRTVSPRFVSLRRRGYINLGIDDNRCIELWYQIIAEADNYKYPVTIAVHANRLAQNMIESVQSGYKRGHEIVSHGISHAPFTLSEGLRMSYNNARGAKSVYLSLGDDHILNVFINDQLAQKIPLGSLEKGDAVTLGALSEVLRKSGVKAELSEDSYRDIPAVLLTKVPHFDLMFKNFAPTLGLQTDAYIQYEVHDSRAKLVASLKDVPVDGIAYPYTAYSPRIAQVAKDSGYTNGRAGSGSNTFSPYAGGLDPYRIYASNIKDHIFPANLAPDITRERTYAILDYINDSGGVISLYSHAADELTLENWRVMMKTIHDDNTAQVMTLQDMAKMMKTQATLRDGRYFLKPPADQSDYHLRKDSTLRGAGKKLGLTHDFEGKPLPSGNPSIGLYQ